MRSEPSVLCIFCGEDVTDRVTPDTVLTCPRCRVSLLVTADVAEGETRVRAAVAEKQGIPTDKVQVVIQKDVVSREDGHLHLVAGWDPDEGLRVSQVGKILGLSRSRVWQMVVGGVLPNARRRAPSRLYYRTGIWTIPRRDVYAYRLRGKTTGKEGRG